MSEPVTKDTCNALHYGLAKSLTRIEGSVDRIFDILEDANGGLRLRVHDLEESRIQRRAAEMRVKTAREQRAEKIALMLFGAIVGLAAWAFRTWLTGGGP